MLILKAAALAIVVCVLVLCLKKDQPGFAFLLSLCGAAGLLWFAVQQLRPLLARLQQLAGQAGGDSFSILLQVLAIAFVAQLAADLCREAGLAAAAFCPVLRVWYITFATQQPRLFWPGPFLFGFVAVVGYGCRIQEVFYVYSQEAGHFPKLVNVRAFPFA